MAEDKDPPEDARDESEDSPEKDEAGDKKADDKRSAEEKSDKDDTGKDKPEEKEEEDKPPFYTRPLFWIIGGGVLLILIIGGTLWWLHARQYESTDDAFIDAHIVRLAAETNGRLSRVDSLDNRHVRKGQLLAIIEPGTPAASLQEARAGVAQADASIKQAEAKVLTAVAGRRQAQANALAPEADARKAQADYQRYLDLKRRDAQAAAPTQIDQARAQAESTAGQAAAARRQIDSADADILAARKEVEAAQAQRAAAQARVKQANVTVSYTTIRAPMAGQVVNRAVNVGSYVAPGQQLMAIVPDQMWVTANFKETQLTHMRRGQPAEIRLDAYPGIYFPGHVDSIQRGAGQAFALLPPQNATGNYVKVVQRVPVRITFDRRPAPQYVIGPGMSVVPRIKIR